jgi:hypothetical protein
MVNSVPVFKFCYHCGTKFVDVFGGRQKFCNTDCYRDFERSSKTKLGHLTRSKKGSRVENSGNIYSF